MERQGSDAVRIQYYPSSSSSMELAAKIDKNNKYTAATKFNFNKYKYDFQFITGLVASEDLILATGWSGYIYQITFRGEASYLHPIKNFKDTTGIFVASIGADYMFDNSVMINIELLYNQQQEQQQYLNFLQVYDAPVSVKNLSFTEYNIFSQISFPINPILNIGCSAIIYPKMNGGFAGFNIGYAAKENIDISFATQTFTANFYSPVLLKKQRIFFNILFLKLQYSI